MSTESEKNIASNVVRQTKQRIFSCCFISRFWLTSSRARIMIRFRIYLFPTDDFYAWHWSCCILCRASLWRIEPRRRETESESGSGHRLKTIYGLTSGHQLDNNCWLLSTLQSPPPPPECCCCSTAREPRCSSSSSIRRQTPSSSPLSHRIAVFAKWNIEKFR